MTSTLEGDLEKLKARAFDRADWAELTLRRYHAVALKLDAAGAQPLRSLYHWIFVPPTLWPFNVQDVLEDCLKVLEKGKRLSIRQRLIIDLLPEPPDETVCAAAAPAPGRRAARRGNCGSQYLSEVLLFSSWRDIGWLMTPMPDAGRCGNLVVLPPVSLSFMSP